MTCNRSHISRPSSSY